jgi:ABC-type transport system involved in cytochrome c biogenesis permease subunit
MNWKRLLPFLAVLLVVFGISLGEILSNAAKMPVDASKKLPPWPKEVVKRFASMPVQEEGRIKPLETLANYQLLAFHGTRTLRLKYSDGTRRTLKPAEWLLDCLFYPEVARHYPVFVVDDPQAVTLVGMTPHESRRQRYSFEEVAPVLPKLKELATTFAAIKEAERQPQQQMIIALAQNATSLERIFSTLDWARDGLRPDSAAAPPPMLADAIKDGKLPFSGFTRALRLQNASLGFEDVPQNIRDIAMGSMYPMLYPPPRPDQVEWMSFGHMIIGGVVQPAMQEKAERALADWETLCSLRDDRTAFAQRLESVAAGTIAEASARGQQWRVPWELLYNRADFFYYALQAFVLAFLAQAITWLVNPATAKARWLHRGTWLAMLVGLVLVASGLVTRAIIMGRWVSAVVTTLYETILFISCVIVVVGLAAELITRRKIALPVTAAISAFGMFLSMKFEMSRGTDTLEPLQAVLNTNYWLSIHVTSVNIGYAAGLLAAGFAGVYLIARLFDPARKDGEFYRTLTGCTYGIVCFGLLFSLVGTILGGLWANDSWGRFWGWDPKENGALMIVLSFLIILHARLGGYIREFGLHMLTLLTGVVVAFSWWHVNLLGVGLHSYGFTSGIKEIVFTFYGLVALVFAMGVAAWLRDRWHREDAQTREGNASSLPAPHPPAPHPALHPAALDRSSS